MMVPLEIDGLRGSYELQLDLGTGWPVLNEVPFTNALAHAGRPPATGETIPLSGSIGTYELVDTEFRLRAAGGSKLEDPSQGKLGSLGLNFFRDRVLVIDFPGRRLAILAPDELPQDVTAEASWVPARYFNGHVYVPVRIGETEYQGFFYDTGASIFPLTTSREIWERVTRRTGTEPDLTVLTVPSWDRKVTLVGAPAAQPVRIGSIEVAAPRVFYLEEGPEELKPQNWDPPIDGMIGNTLFLDSWVIVDLPRNRFGLIPKRR